MQSCITSWRRQSCEKPCGDSASPGRLRCHFCSSVGRKFFAVCIETYDGRLCSGLASPNQPSQWSPDSFFKTNIFTKGGSGPSHWGPFWSLLGPFELHFLMANGLASTNQPWTPSGVQTPFARRKPQHLPSNSWSQGSPVLNLDT